MSEIKEGDFVWVQRRVTEVYGDGYIRVAPVGEEHASDVILDSPYIVSLSEEHVSSLRTAMDTIRSG